MSLIRAADNMPIGRYVAVTLSLALTLITARSPVSAQSLEEHFRGKEIRLLIGSSAGGGYDTFARTIAAHWPKHIPGNPIFVPQNLPWPDVASGGQSYFLERPKRRHDNRRGQSANCERCYPAPGSRSFRRAQVRLDRKRLARDAS